MHLDNLQIVCTWSPKEIVGFVARVWVSIYDRMHPAPPSVSRFALLYARQGFLGISSPLAHADVWWLEGTHNANII